MSVRILASADVDGRARIGDGTVVWHLAQVREEAHVGQHCVIGRGAYVGAGVSIGDNVKIQNYALVYEPASVADGAFIGPAAVLTNDRYPRSVDPAGSRKSADDWDAAGVSVGTGAAIGARAVVLAGVSLGAWSMVAAGSVVTRDVPPFALVAGTPAKPIGWVGRAGHPLDEEQPGTFRCPVTGDLYQLGEDGLTEVTA